MREDLLSVKQHRAFDTLMQLFKSYIPRKERAEFNDQVQKALNGSYRIGVLEATGVPLDEEKKLKQSHDTDRSAG